MTGKKTGERTGIFLMIGGLLLCAAALALALYNFWDANRAAALVESTLADLSTQEITAPLVTEHSENTQLNDILNNTADLAETILDRQTYAGTLEIPALSLNLPVMNKWSYQNLKIAPCRYMGTPYQKNMILCAHNYECHFGTIRNLQAGDEVIFTDMSGIKFCYTVSCIELLSGKDSAGLKGGNWPLTLFTCTLDGQSRVTVRCVEADS